LDNRLVPIEAIPMYEAFYGLREKPFSILPDPDMIYWCQNHRLAFAMLEFSVLNSAGFTVITGEIGCGKTTLIRKLLRKLDHHITTCLISNTPHGQDGLLPWILMSLNQPFEGSHPALFKQFQRFLYDQSAKGRRTILIVDEAQNLGSETLEELRMLSNINTDKDQFLQVILAGQPQLKELLRAPQLSQFAQRISSDFHLKPLNKQEVIKYIDFRLSAVGSKSTLFTDEACELIADTSCGIPRTINIMCDTALVYGFAAEAKRITEQLVTDVIQNKAQFGVLPFGLQPSLG
jgi:type II secretory pathway predicted ATPase ExeA